MKSKKVAIVHDWLCVDGGAEVVLNRLLLMFPKADIYTTVDILSDDKREFLRGHKIYTTVLQKYKFIAKRYSYFMHLMPYLIEQFDLSKYDMVISSSHFVAKGVITHPEQLHFAYIYSPVRYAWDMYFEYDRAGAFGKRLKNIFMKKWLHRMRIWDFVSSYRADYLISDSKFIQKRIRKYWRRNSTVVYPPVEIANTVYHEEKKEYYITLSRLVEYKRVDIIIRAFNEFPNKELIIIGDGRAKDKLVKMSKSNINFKGYLPRVEAMTLISRAKAFVFMAKEDFGIVPIEAQACGTPVVAYGQGGVKETVLEGETGVFVEKQDKDSLKEAILKFEKISFSPKKCREFSEKFSPQEFEKKITKIFKGKL